MLIEAALQVCQLPDHFLDCSGILGPPSGADRHLDITFGLQVVENFSLVSVVFREALNHPYISFFHLVVNGFSVTCFRTFIT